MDSKTPDNSGDLFGDLAEPALLTSKTQENSGGQPQKLEINP